ncbi:hypothetical protein PCCS19_28270 [Paenibacillus sp. CCS19]|nr:hypothetical protein PCCS19_28270 [Paenibacillus cellulosilyticus]
MLYGRSHEDRNRKSKFYWIGNPGEAMLGIRENYPSSNVQRQHFAFRVDLAVSIYFSDPDGHSIEFIAMLKDEPRPELAIMSWSEWEHLQDRHF